MCTLIYSKRPDESVSAITVGQLDGCGMQLQHGGSYNNFVLPHKLLQSAHGL